MKEEEKKELHKDYSKVFNYDPSFEEVNERYDEDFDKRLDDYIKQKLQGKE